MPRLPEHRERHGIPAEVLGALRPGRVAALRAPLRRPVPGRAGRLPHARDLLQLPRARSQALGRALARVVFKTFTV